MRTYHVSTVLAGILALSLSVPAVAAEKISGVNKEYQTLSETSTTVPDKPDHVVKQLTGVHRTTCQGGAGSCTLGEFWASEVAQQDIIGTDNTIGATEPIIFKTAIWAITVSRVQARPQ